MSDEPLAYVMARLVVDLAELREVPLATVLEEYGLRLEFVVSAPLLTEEGN